MQHAEGVVVAVGGERQHGTDAGERQVQLGVFGLRVAEVAGQVAHPRLTAELPGRIAELNRHPLIRQRSADGPRHRVGSDDEPGVGGTLAHLEQPGQRCRSEALQHHGGDDHRKHQGDQLVRIGNAGFMQADGEGGADRRRDYAARRDPAEQGTGPPGEIGSPGGDQDAERTRHELHHAQQRQHHGAELPELGQIEAGCQQDEEGGDEDDGEILLEGQHLLQIQPLLIGEPDAEHGHRQQAGFVAEPVGEAEGDQHQRQHPELVQTDRQPVLADQQGGEPTGTDPDERAHPHRLGQRQQGVADQIPLAAEANRLEHQHRKQGADGIDDDPLPAQDAVHLPGRADHVEHGGDHGRAGHHQHGAEYHGDPPVQPQQEVAGAADDGEAHQHAGGAEVAHHLADPLELGQVQGERPLEQDDGDRQRDQREQQVAEQGIGVEQAADRPQQQAGEQQKQDGGHSQRPGQPLGQH